MPAATEACQVCDVRTENGSHAFPEVELSLQSHNQFRFFHFMKNVFVFFSTIKNQIFVAKFKLRWDFDRDSQQHLHTQIIGNYY